MIKNVAPERITQEIISLFSGKYYADTLEQMYNDGILEIIFPFVAKMRIVPSNQNHHLDLIHHSIEVVRNIETDNPMLKLAAFCHDIGKPDTWTIDEKNNHYFFGHEKKGSELIKNELKHLKFSKKQLNYLEKIIRFHMMPLYVITAQNNKKAYSNFLKTVGDDAQNIIELSKADVLSTLGPSNSVEKTKETLYKLDQLSDFCSQSPKQYESIKPFLNGNEIMQILNIKPSKEVGIIMSELINAQIKGVVSNRDKAIKFVRKMYLNKITI